MSFLEFVPFSAREKEKDTALSFHSFALVGSGKTLAQIRKSSLRPLQGTNPPFDLLFGAIFNLPDLLKPNNLSTSRLQYVFKLLCLFLKSPFYFGLLQSNG